MYQSPVHQSEGLPEVASTGINEEQDGHGTQYEPLRRPWTRPELGPPLAWSYKPRIEEVEKWVDDAILERTWAATKYEIVKILK